MVYKHPWGLSAGEHEKQNGRAAVQETVVLSNGWLAQLLMRAKAWKEKW